MKEISTREFLIGAGAFSASFLLSKFFEISSVQAKVKPQKWPWPYEKLDPEKTAEIAYNEWYRIFCGGAVISSIFSQLAEKIGEPYASFPIDAFIIMEGGVAGWGTICGSLNGAAVVANCICGPRIAGLYDGHIIASNLMKWYSETELPIYVPKNPRANKKSIIKTVSESPLCHISVGKWMKASGHAYRSPERRDRCARVTASVAYELVKKLNAWKDGEYDEELEWYCPSDFGVTGQMNCMECHGTEIPVAPQPKK